MGRRNIGQSIRRKCFRKIRGLFVREPALLLRRRTDHNANKLITAEAREFRDLVLGRHHDPGTAAIEPVAQLIRRQQRGRGDHHHPELHCRQHGLPQRNDIAEQQQKMIAALEPLRAQEVCDLIGTARQRPERQLCFAIAAGIDDPQRRPVLAFGIARQFRIDPIQRPIKRHRIRPAESLHCRIVVGAMLQQECAGFLKCGHIKKVSPFAPPSS
jgi:hypothetical protein